MTVGVKFSPQHPSFLPRGILPITHVGIPFDEMSLDFGCINKIQEGASSGHLKQTKTTAVSYHAAGDEFLLPWFSVKRVMIVANASIQLLKQRYDIQALVEDFFRSKANSKSRGFEHA